jgi:3-oxoisoapionate decarboxylase
MLPVGNSSHNYSLMKNAIKKNNIYISIYSFGYGAMFINDYRRNNDLRILSPIDLIDICHKYDLSGIELPIDRYCSEFDSKQISKLFDQIYNNNLEIKVDFENISSKYTNNILPLLKDYGIEYFRVKISNFFGCNRYNHPEFNLHYNDFIQYIDDVINSLMKYEIKILIENHQDIILDDYYKIWDIFPREHIGINWDTGNSIPALETPMDFLNKMFPYIGNIHLKDYNIYQTNNGYKLVRCPLGKGVVDFYKIFSFIREKNIEIPMTIELGAMNSRQSDIYIDKFWEALPSINEEHKGRFINYIESNYKTDQKDETLWEKNFLPEEIYKSEFEDIDSSIEYLNNL